MQHPSVRHVVTCLPCGYREGVRPGNAYPPRCPNCGTGLEHYTAAIDSWAELRDLPCGGSRSVRFERPRLVIGSPA